MELALLTSSEGEKSWRVINYHIFRIFLNKLGQLHSISPSVEEAGVPPRPGRGRQSHKMHTQQYLAEPPGALGSLQLFAKPQMPLFTLLSSRTV